MSSPPALLRYEKLLPGSLVRERPKEREYGVSTPHDGKGPADVAPMAGRPGVAGIDPASGTPRPPCEPSGRCRMCPSSPARPGARRFRWNGSPRCRNTSSNGRNR